MRKGSRQAMQEEALRAQLEQALGGPLPDRASAEWPAFVRRVATERPALFEAHFEFFTGLSNHAVPSTDGEAADEAALAIPDESPEEPYEQQRRRAIARLRRQRLIERLFYRRDFLGRPVLDKRKAILWTMLGVLALLAPMMASTQFVVDDRRRSQDGLSALASPPEITPPLAPPAPSAPQSQPAPEPGGSTQAANEPAPKPMEDQAQAASVLPAVAAPLAPPSSPAVIPPALPSAPTPPPSMMSSMAGMPTDAGFPEPGGPGASTGLTVYALRLPAILRQDVSASALSAVRPDVVVYDTPLAPSATTSSPGGAGLQPTGQGPLQRPDAAPPASPGPAPSNWSDALAVAASRPAVPTQASSSSKPSQPTASLTVFQVQTEPTSPSRAFPSMSVFQAASPSPDERSDPASESSPGSILLLSAVPASSASPASGSAAGPAGPPALVLYHGPGTAQAAILTGEAGRTPSAPTAPSGSASTPSAAKSPYRTGQQLVAHLETRLIVPMIQTQDLDSGVPVVAKTTDGTVWLGKATPGDTNYLQLRFTQAVQPDGTTFAVQAIALSPDGAVGLAPKIEEKTPTLAQDLLRSAIAGVSSYVEAMAQASTIVQSPNGFVSIQQQVPDVKWMVAGEVAKLFKLPQDSRAVVRIGEVPKGTELRILVMDPSSR